MDPNDRERQSIGEKRWDARPPEGGFADFCADSELTASLVWLTYAPRTGLAGKVKQGEAGKVKQVLATCEGRCAGLTLSSLRFLL